MGWLVWAVETLLCIASAYLVAAAVYPDRGALHRLIATALVAPSLILVSIQAVGFAKQLRPVPLAIVAALAFGAAGWIALRRVGRERALSLWRSDVGAPARLWRQAWAEKDPAILAAFAGAIVLLAAAGLSWIYRSFTWDPVWYHTPITYYAIQMGSLEWIDSTMRGVPWTITHPRNVELLAAWNCIFPLDNRLDETGQLPFGVLGAAVVAAWARDVGARPPFAAALGGTWLLLPPIYLQIWSTHVDVACGAAFAAGVYFMSRRPEPRDRWMSMLALGLYLGSKMTGLFHLALLSPWIAARVGVELWRSPGARLRTLGDAALSFGALLAVGSYKYVQNTLVTGNPLYAFKQRIPVLGIELPGLFDPAIFYGGRPGESPLFFGVQGSFEKLLQSWYREPPTFWPDVRTGGFGPAFAYLLVPAVLVVALEVIRPSRWGKVLPILALFAAALVVQSPWWPRFVIGAAMASLVALGRLQGLMIWRSPRLATSAALLALGAWTFWQGAEAQFQHIDLFQWPKSFGTLVRATPEERATHRVIDWLWPTEWKRAMEQEFQAGDVMAYDDSVYFLGEYFARDFRTRVLFVPSTGDPDAYVRRLEALGARWAGVMRGSQAEAALRARGAEFLFAAPVSRTVLYRLRR